MNEQYRTQYIETFTIMGDSDGNNNTGAIIVGVGIALGFICCCVCIRYFWNRGNDQPTFIRVEQQPAIPLQVVTMPSTR